MKRTWGSWAGAVAVMAAAACGLPGGRLSGDAAGIAPVPDVAPVPDSAPDAAMIDARAADAALPDAPSDAPPDAPPDALPLVGLVVATAGDRAGLVADTEGAIACPPACAAQFPVGHKVTLTATPSASAIFVGWDGACHGVGPCIVTLAQDTAVSARFGAPAVEWARISPGTDWNVLGNAAAHPSGDLIVEGRFTTTVSLSGGPVWTATNLLNPSVIGRLAASDGHHVWSRALPQDVQALDVDDDGNVLAVLRLNYSINLDGVLYSGGPVQGAFVVSFDGEDGSVRWARIVGDATDEGGNKGVMVDLHGALTPDGDAVLWGTVSGKLLFGGQTYAPQDLGLALVRLAGSDGSLRWVDFIDGPGRNRAGAVGVTPSGRIVIAGSAENSIAFPGQPATTTAPSDSFLAALDGDGQHVAWQRMLGGGFTDQFALQGAQLGVLGRLRGPVDLGTGSLQAVPTPHPANEKEPIDAFVGVLDGETGAPAWARVVDLGYTPRGFGETRNLLLADLLVAPSGAVVLVGDILEPLRVADLEVVYPASFENGVVLTLGPDGNATRVARLGGPGRAAVNAIAATAGGLFATAGATETCDLGGVRVTSTDDADGFLLRLAPAATGLDLTTPRRAYLPRMGPRQRGEGK